MTTIHTRSRLIAAMGLVAVIGVAEAGAQQVECAGSVKNVAAVTKPTGHIITRRYQLDRANLQPLLATTIDSAGGCLVAHLSGQVRITDNYVVFQVRVDGVPLEGQLPLLGISTPVVFVAIDASTVNQDEQLIDPTKAVSFNFFANIPRGRHTVEVLGAAGSTVDTGNPPTATHLVLTLSHP